ncbi:hypothetical protein HOLleu_22244 [Holothuria leucospilota]|uniref:Uncharacterized protein n=1 Tax=Holothuria leucospilota TaxID=206669 RepID=A0A9Q1BYV5_HOLLE|nr:hypothetical protein HOLleu_22244 [Holothuria leucospilota]
MHYQPLDQTRKTLSKGLCQPGDLPGGEVTRPKPPSTFPTIPYRQSKGFSPVVSL